MSVDPARLKDVFSQALARTDPTDRAAFLDAACAGDLELRSRVEALLRASADPDSMLDGADPAPPPNDATGTATFSGPECDPAPTRSLPPISEHAGTVVAGRYKLLQTIGEGGMGAVWMADQTEPVKRRVAVKLIRADRVASRTILTRFEAERQAIALMSHPNIARLLDAGTTDDGQPFFVMELVKGVALTDYCDAHKLSVPDRLSLFRQICSAVHHAHQKGVIHRDLKPTNILVESHDGKPVPKVIDFGLAKATTGMQLTEHTLFTGFGNVMGTPLYMAPEQATFNALDVDSRADIYALGVILYELLAGSTPIHKDTLKAAALDEMLRVIREQEPPPPSSRLSTSEAKPAIAANRGSEPVKLGRFVRGELDWIVMKALAKERDRRYESATALAADVERFLGNEPVSAGPPSQWYRLRKFVRRNKGRVAAAAAVLLALLAGVAGTSLGLVRALDAEASARRNEGEARDATKRADDYSHDLEAEQHRLRDSRLHALRLLYASQISHAQRAVDGYDTQRLVELLGETTPRPGEDDCRGWEWHYLNRQVRSWESETVLEGYVHSGLRWNARGGAVTTRDGSRFVVPPAPADSPRDRSGNWLPNEKRSLLPALVFDTASGRVVTSRSVGDNTEGHQISPCGRFMAYFEPIEAEAKDADAPKSDPLAPKWGPPLVSARVRLVELATGRDIPVPLPPVHTVGIIRLSDDARRLTVFANPDRWPLRGPNEVRNERKLPEEGPAVRLVWERGQEKHTKYAIPAGKEKPSATLGLSPDGNTAYLLHSPKKSEPTGGFNPSDLGRDTGRVLELWDLTAPEPRLLTAHKPGGSIQPLGFSGSGGVFAVADADRQSSSEPPVVSLLDARTGAPKGRWVIPAGVLSGIVSNILAVSDDGRRVVVSESHDLLVVGERTDAEPTTAPGRWRTHVRRSPQGPGGIGGGAGRGCLSLWISPEGARMTSVEALGWGRRAALVGASGSDVVRRTWDLTRNPEYAGTWPEQLVLDGVPCRPTPDLRTRRVSYLPPSGGGGVAIGPGAPAPDGAWSGKRPEGGWPVASFDPLQGRVTHRFVSENKPSRAQLSVDGTRALLSSSVGTEQNAAKIGQPNSLRPMPQEFLLRTVGRAGGDGVLWRIERPVLPRLYDGSQAPAPYLTSDGRWVIETETRAIPLPQGVLDVSKNGQQYTASAYKVWSAIDGELSCTIPVTEDSIAHLTYASTADGGRLIVQSFVRNRGPVPVRTTCYDPAGGAALWAHEGEAETYASSFRNVNVSADGRVVALGGLGIGASPTRAYLIEAASGVVLRELRGDGVTGGLPGGLIDFGVLGPNGWYALCAGDRVLVWDGQHPEPVYRLVVESATQAVFSTDGRRLFTFERGFGNRSAGPGGSAIRVWDLATGRELLVIRLPAGDTSDRAGFTLFRTRLMWMQGERLMLWWNDGIRVFDGTPAGK